MRTGTIVAMGGGGFSMEPENPVLDDFVLSLVPHPGRRPRVCFVPTASGDAEGYIERFQESFAGRAETSVLSLFRRERADLRPLLLDQDVVYVGGGSTANLLAVWRLHGLDALLAEAMAEGTVLAGLSAGMNCWFEGSVTDSFGERLEALPDGLGFLPGSACPHYDGEPERRPTYHRTVAAGTLPAGYAADDGCALLFRDGVLTDAVSSRETAGGYRVERAGDGVVERPLEVRRLR